MTIEEKAKAYDEALIKAKELLDSPRTCFGIVQLKDIFPELRGSEDESLKNKSGYYKGGKFWKASTLWQAVKNKIPQRVPNRYILQDCTWNISSLRAFADEVKNVQEAELDYPIILDINGNILDGAHRVVKAYLQNKDIDVVYLGDDEWPEPDYDEEKAVKESEDERIRKQCIQLLRDAYSTKYEAFECIDWLEKQKEGEEELVYRLNGLMQDYIKEGKDDEEKEHRLKCYQLFWDALEDTNFFEQKEQKPAVSEHDAYELLSKKGYMVIEREVYNELCEKAEQKPDNKCKGCNNVKGCINCVDGSEWAHIEEIEQKPAEWSEEDEGLLDEAIHMLDGGWVRSDDAIKQVSDFLNSLPERFNLQSKQEWSEEDEEMLDAMVDIVANSLYEPLCPRDKMLDWLKFLRPQPKAKLTLLDENIIKAAVAFVEQNDHFNCWGGIDKHMVIKALRSIKPSWKPSEKQPEVDLEKEVHNYLKTHHLHIKDGGRIVFDNDDSPNFMCDIRDIARHFYELGLNARKI